MTHPTYPPLSDQQHLIRIVLWLVLAAVLMLAAVVVDG